jgi:hypothetical protein
VKHAASIFRVEGSSKRMLMGCIEVWAREHRKFGQSESSEEEIRWSTVRTNTNAELILYLSQENPTV